MGLALENLRPSETKLLQKRICDLEIPEEHARVRFLERQLTRELEDAGFTYFLPRLYIGDEWFTPGGSTLISVPFYLCRPDLMKLEKRVIGCAEGYTREWAMRLLRHEAGHCFDHAYNLSKTKEWQRYFGSPRRKYDVDNYKFDPMNRDYVLNLENHYAQAHPEEDFAETFAVWLNPESRWRSSYRQWPGALRKLRYIDRLVTRFKDEPIHITGYQRPMGEARHARRTLKTYYRRKLREIRGH